MTRLALIAITSITLAACGQGETGSATASPAKPPRPALSPAEAAAVVASLPAPYNQGDLENGRRVFARCRSCHTINEGGSNMVGPNLYGVFGRPAGGLDGYNYSPVIRAAGFEWDAARLDHWLENPRTFLKGTKMTFAGLPDATDRRDVIAFLKVETGYAPPPSAQP